MKELDIVDMILLGIRLRQVETPMLTTAAGDDNYPGDSVPSEN